ncbi:hypothetical protein [Novosphingobium sp.]|uniref:hypothetical protein n=1 Tax=Novosphingobium sp. TaxID=1874826 RepID=UPI002FE0F871
MSDSLAMRDLLIRLDQKVGDGFAQIHAKLDAMERRADGHDKRLTALEQETIQQGAKLADYADVKERLSTIETERAREKGVLAGGRLIVGLVSGATVALAGLLVKFLPLLLAA